MILLKKNLKNYDLDFDIFLDEIKNSVKMAKIYI